MRALLAAAMALLVLPAASAQVAPVAATQPVGEPDWGAYTVREELGAAGELAGARRVLRFVQVSDAHILDDDAPYPMRQEPLDPVEPPFGAAQRPQEEYTDEVLDSVVSAVNAQHAADPLQFVLNTGDNIDNDLENELMRFIDLYEGTSTLAGPVSGYPCRPDGQSESTGDASTDVIDACTSLPLALASAAGRGLAPGLPWYSAFGNHDALIQGNANVEPSFQDVATQFGRRFLLQPEYVAMHFPGADSCPGGPGGSVGDDFGHGYGFAGERLCDGDPDNDGYYALDAGPVRFLVLDTVNDDFVTANGNLQGQFNPQTMTGADVIGGYAEGSVDPAQAAWLQGQVAASADRLVVIVSHHTVNSMFTNLASGYCAPDVGCLGDLLRESGYKTGEELTAELAASPNVVAWIGGHTHRHRVQAKGQPGAGFWNIESSSLIDWPQEARTVELWATADGAKAFWRLTTFGHGFQASKDLELTDDQRQPTASGQDVDRDVLLWFDVPPGVSLPPLPEVPRQWRIRVADPTASGTVGQPFNVTLAIDDLLHPAGPLPAGLAADWAVHHSPIHGSEQPLVDVADRTGLTLSGNGSALSATGAFTPPEAGTYYGTVRLLDRAGSPLASQLVSLNVVGGDGGNESPGFPAALLLIAVAAALAMRRRPAA